MVNKFLILVCFFSLTTCESPLNENMTIESSPQGIVIEDFSRNDLLNWSVVDDGVMGGRSQGYLSLKGEIATFRGYLSLQNNGGFWQFHNNEEDNNSLGCVDIFPLYPKDHLYYGVQRTICHKEDYENIKKQIFGYTYIKSPQNCIKTLSEKFISPISGDSIFSATNSCPIIGIFITKFVLSTMVRFARID